MAVQEQVLGCGVNPLQPCFRRRGAQFSRADTLPSGSDQAIIVGADRQSPHLCLGSGFLHLRFQISLERLQPTISPGWDLLRPPL